MKVITVANQKGGTMKSGLVTNLAVEAMRRGRKVTVLELDRQGTASDWNAKRGAQIVNKIDASALEQMLKVLRGVQVDLVLIDLPGSHSTAVSLAIKESDFVLIPARPQPIDISASAETLAVIQRLGKEYAYVLTFVEPTSMKRASEAAEALIEEGHAVAPQFIARRQAFVDALSEGKTASEVEPSGRAADEITELWKWVEKQIEASHERVIPSNGKNTTETRH